MRAVIGRSWAGRLWAFRRRRRPLVRLWDAELNYVSTIADGGISETWGEWARRLARAALRPANGTRAIVDLANGGSLTIDVPVL